MYDHSSASFFKLFPSLPRTKKEKPRLHFLLRRRRNSQRSPSLHTPTKPTSLFLSFSQRPHPPLLSFPFLLSFGASCNQAKTTSEAIFLPFCSDRFSFSSLSPYRPLKERTYFKLLLLPVPLLTHQRRQYRAANGRPKTGTGLNNSLLH